MNSCKVCNIYIFLIQILVLKFILLLLGGECYAQSDDENEEQLIEFNFKSKRFDKIVPFDQYFSIKLTDIPPEVKRVRIQFYEYNLKGVKFKSGSLITPEQLAEYRIIYQTEDWERAHKEDTSGEVPVPYLLKPNQKYIITISGEDIRKLTDEEQKALSSSLLKNKEIVNIVNDISKRYLLNPTSPPVYAPLNITQEEFNRIATQAVYEFNKDYRVDEINPVAQLTELAQFVDDLNNLLLKLNDLEGQKSTLKDKSAEDSISQLIQKLREQIKLIDWGTIESGDEEYIKLIKIKDAIFASYPAPLSGLIATQKSYLENLIDSVLTHRDTWLNTITYNIISKNTIKYQTLDATYRADFVKNAKQYVSLDLGAAYVWRVDRVISYSGVNIYLRPINKSIPLEHYKNWEDWFAVRTSILIGVTLGSIEKAEQRKGLFGNSAGLIGLGFRPTSFLKINGGTLIYYSNHTNPLISKDTYNTTFSPFVSLSVDLDAKALFGGVGEAIFK